MNLTRPHLTKARRAFTLVELMVSAGIVTIAGAVILLIFNSGMILFAKNTATNLAHEDTRLALGRLERDINQAVSTPYFVNASLVAYSSTSTATAEGVSFQVYGGTPGEYFEVYTDAAKTDTSVIITGSSYTPVVGQRLIIPSYQIERDITAVSTTGTGITAQRTLTLSGGALGASIDASSGANVYTSSTGDYHIICYITNRVYYVSAPIAGTNPQAYELRYYPSYNATYNTSYITLIRSLYVDKPFQVSTINSSTNNRFVQISLNISDPTSNRRNYQAMNVYLSRSVPYLARMTTYQ